MRKTEFWKGKRVFLTGHTGFKGSWLSLWLNYLEAEVTGYSKDIPTTPALFEQAGISELVNDLRGDICDQKNLENAMRDAEPEIVFHMAAQPLVRLSYEDPVGTYETNVMGTLKVLESIRKTPGIKSVVIITTDKCYENMEWHWGYRENEAMGGFDPYSSSKGCTELLTSSYRRSFFNNGEYGDNHNIAIATARAGNVIGGGDWAKDRLVPDLVKAISSSEVVKIRSPYAVRPWQHVLEPLNGYLMLAQAMYEKGVDYAKAWNFGPNDSDAKTVKWIVHEICRLWDNNNRYIIDDNPQPHEAHYLKLDISQAKQELKWEPRWDLKKTLEKIIEWVKVYKNNGDIRQICLDQIKEFENV